jgi:periodic tryptophan protein 1
MMMGAAFDDDDDKNGDAGEEYESSDSEGEDNLDDIPDTREYMPLDVDGLHSLGIGGSGGGGGSKMHSNDVGYTMEDLQSMTMNDVDDDEDDDDEDQEDMDDVQLRDSDALIVVAKTEEDFASLEVNIFDTQSSNLYVHHDIPLPSYPLCLALGCVVPSDNNNGTARAGNYVAVGSFEPAIEVWNLDVMNALEPTLVLGGMDTRGAEENWIRMHQAMKPSSTTISGKKMQKKTKKTKNGSVRGGRGTAGLREGSHTDAVMGLSWNTVHRQVLASASADGTVKLWDVTQTHGDYIRPSATLAHHTDKVQSLAWHPTEGTLLATGGYDRRVCLVDARSAAAVSTANNANQSVKTAKLLADCEALAWDPHNQQYLTAASEDGTVQCWDVRKFGSDPVWSFVAHEYGGVSDISYNT